MFNIKTLIATALLSSVAVVSFAQAPAAPKAVNGATPAAVTAPADATPKAAAKKVKKHTGMKHKKASAAKPAASAAK